VSPKFSNKSCLSTQLIGPIDFSKGVNLVVAAWCDKPTRSSYGGVDKKFTYKNGDRVRERYCTA
jgi:hypothetical protein